MTMYRNQSNSSRGRGKIFLVILVIAMLAIGASVALLRKPFLFIQRIDVVGTESLDAHTISQYTQEYLDNFFLRVIPKKNILIFSKSAFSEWLIKKEPSIKQVAISFDQEKNMILDITERKPRVLWCQENRCFFVSHDGLIYREAPMIGDGIFLKIQGMVLENPIGTILKNTIDFESIVKTVDFFERHGILVTRVEVGIPYRFFIYHFFDYPTVINTFIQIESLGFPDKLVDTLRLLMTDTVFKDLLEKKSKKLEYIDITIPHKIYYKFL